MLTVKERRQLDVLANKDGLSLRELFCQMMKTHIPGTLEARITKLEKRLEILLCTSTTTFDLGDITEDCIKCDQTCKNLIHSHPWNAK